MIWTKTGGCKPGPDMPWWSVQILLIVLGAKAIQVPRRSGQSAARRARRATFRVANEETVAWWVIGRTKC